MRWHLLAFCKTKKKSGAPPVFLGAKFGEVCFNMDSNRAYQRKAIEQFEQALAMPSPGPSFTNEKIRSFYHPESFLRSRRPRNVSIRSVRVLHPYLVPEQSAFCWGAVPCPFSPTGLAPWVVARMAHIRSMEYPSMQKQMLDFVEMVIDLSAQRLRNKRAYSHIDSSDPELWSLFQVASECRQSVEFWLVFSTVLDYFGAC